MLIPFSVLVDDLDFYFEFDFAADIRDLSDMQQGEQPGSSSRDKANQMLRRLESCGWIYTEVDYSYVQRVNFRDYAVQIIRTLKQIETAKTTEYQGYIYTIYNLSRAKGNPGLALAQIVENTDLLITGLKSLNANIHLMASRLPFLLCYTNYNMVTGKTVLCLIIPEGNKS